MLLCFFDLFPLPLPSALSTHTLRRSDAVHAAGPLTYKDLMKILPMIDDTVVMSVTGQQLLEALENGVSMYPKQEGRFPQVGEGGGGQGG